MKSNLNPIIECAFGDDEENCPEKKVKYMKYTIIETEEKTTTAATTTATSTTSISTTLDSTTSTEEIKAGASELPELPPFFDDFSEKDSNATVVLKSHNSTETREGIKEKEELEIIHLVRVAPPKPDSVRGTLPSLILTSTLLLFSLLF